MRFFISIVFIAFGLCASAFASSGPYRFRAGDLLEIFVWQEPKLNRQVVVAPDGMIAVPLAGRIKAGGRTAQAVETSLKERLSKQYKDELDITVSLISQKPVQPK